MPRLPAADQEDALSAPVSAVHELDAPVPAVLAALTSEAWPAALAARLNDGSRVLERTPLPDGGLRLVVRRNLPEGVPAPLQRFLPQDGAVVQVDEWHGDSGRWDVGFGGAPGTLRGVTRVEPVGEGRSRWVVEGEVTVTIPLVGGRAEGFLAPLVERLLEHQASVLRTLV